MKITKVGSNMKQIETATHLILVSYATPVACKNKRSGRVYKTDVKWSSTTTRHINKWCPIHGTSTTEKEQQYFDDLIKS